LRSPQTLLGHVRAVTGATVNVYLAESVASGLSIINGSTYRVGQVGSFVRIPLGYQDLFGVVSDVGVNATPESVRDSLQGGARWMKVQLVGEAIGSLFERGISQHPNVNDEVHLVTEPDLFRIYGRSDRGKVSIGRLSSAEAVEVRIDVDKLLTRHCAVLGSTGSGKSTTVASMLRSIAGTNSETHPYPSARILLLDIHGEYSDALSDISTVFRINANKGQQELSIPYWAIDQSDLLGFLAGGAGDDKSLHFFDKITELKLESLHGRPLPGVDDSSLTVDTPVAYSLKRLWLELIDVELRTFEGPNRDQLALLEAGDADSLTPPKYKPHGMGSSGPFLNSNAPGIKRQLGHLRSRLLDKRYDFLLHPGDWEPDANGVTHKDLPDLLSAWLGSASPITILDLSGIPSTVLVRLVGSILRVTYESLFWSRDKSEGAIERPLLVVMEEAHRYLGVPRDADVVKGSSEQGNSARRMVQRIVKEGRKYGIGAMIVSQRPSEVDDTILSQCGTFVALRLSNPVDRSSIQGTLPDNLATLMDMLPVLRTGEAIIIGEAATLPMRCRVTFPGEGYRPNSQDPQVAKQWALPRRTESYERVVASWRAQSPRAKLSDTIIPREPVSDGPTESEG
jgi:DNA helicase HerA-like ATPase